MNQRLLHAALLVPFAISACRSTPARVGGREKGAAVEVSGARLRAFVAAQAEIERLGPRIMSPESKSLLRYRIALGEDDQWFYVEYIPILPGRGFAVEFVISKEDYTVRERRLR